MLWHVLYICWELGAGWHAVACSLHLFLLSVVRDVGQVCSGEIATLNNCAIRWGNDENKKQKQKTGFAGTGQDMGGEAGQDRTGQDRTWAGQDRTGAGQDRTGQDRTGQELDTRNGRRTSTSTTNINGRGRKQKRGHQTSTTNIKHQTSNNQTQDASA
jgi:hypothetical protein